MIFITGDKHNRYEAKFQDAFQEMLDICYAYETTKDDFMIITGDVEVNCSFDKTDSEIKKWLETVPVTFVMVRGNHEERPENIPVYTRTHIKRENFEGDVFVEEKYPSLLFADNGLMRIEDKTFYVINGAYSVDKYWRLMQGKNWFEDEELFDWEMDKIRKEMEAPGHVDVVLSHTCPAKFIPEDAKIPGLDESTISKRMENFLDEVEEKLDYDSWYCGHWHIDEIKEGITFLHHEIMVIE